jgi:hypothetical protein
MLVNAQLGRSEDAIAEARAVERYAPHNRGMLYSAACAYALSQGDQGSSAAAIVRGHVVRLRRLAIASGFRDP